MADTSPVSHEGNPKQDTLTIEGGNLLTTATLGIVLPFEEPPVIVPPETPPPPGGGGSCEGLQPSQLDQLAINQCQTSEGDGCVVTCPGDYDFDPVFYGAACEDYYGDWRFGLNASQVGDGTDLPVWYSSADRWLPPKGFIVLNSTCPAFASRALIFDLPNQASPSAYYHSLTPETFQAQFIDADNAFRGVDIVTHDPQTAGQFDCRFQFQSSGSEYKSQVSALYLASLNNPSGGIGLITTDGTDPHWTGYGLIIDRPTNQIRFVHWDDAAPGNYDVLHATTYVPTANDTLRVEAIMQCQCPYPGLPTATPYPVSGKIRVYISPEAGGTIYDQATNIGSLAPIDWRGLGYGVIAGLPVSNTDDLNLLIFREVYIRFLATTGIC